MIDDDAVFVKQADRRDNGVLTAGEQLQHGAGVGGVERFF